MNTTPISRLMLQRHERRRRDLQYLSVGPLAKAATCFGCRAILMPMANAVQMTLGGRETTWCADCWPVKR